MFYGHSQRVWANYKGKITFKMNWKCLIFIFVVFGCGNAIHIENTKSSKSNEHVIYSSEGLSSDVDSLKSALENSKDPDKEGKLWVVLAAGSWGWGNYRHQADVCHAYHIVRQHGIPDERIVVFMKDDIANNPENPDPGVIMNSPNGTNVYKGVPKDYTGNNLDSLNFLNVLMGKTMNVGSGKTLNTGPKDRIFVYFADHGGPGLSQFGNNSHHGMLYATNLTDTLNEMHKQKKYGEMVLYWESCNSGSMFLNLSSNINVYALSAANATQSSFACYCAPEFWGKSNVHCFGDCFSVHWMEDADDEDLRNETLLIQFWITRHETDMNHYRKFEVSHVEQWGSVAKMNNEKLSQYLGSAKNKTNEGTSVGYTPRGFAIPQSEVALQTVKMQYKHAKTKSEKRIAQNKLKDFKDKRERLDQKIKKIMKTAHDKEIVNGHLSQKQQNILFDNDPNTVLTRDQYEKCFYPLVQTFQDHCFNFRCNDYAIYRIKKFLPLCKAGISQDVITEAIKNQCIHSKPICGIN